LLAIGCLPLAENYSLTYRNFDLQRQKVKLVRLAVSGSEKVTVPAGTFETFRLEVTAADGGSGDRATIWVDKASRQPVRASTVSSGGAIATSELTK
jgi:outer membrane lipoprotein-sorting protein